MAFTVHVENFQSLLDVTVEVDGFTVITGTNNTGKSALLRAIRGAFQNARGTSYIRHGKTKSLVEITFAEDGRTVRWEKGKGAGDKPTYVVDGGSPLHPGQAVPDEVRALGIKPIMAGGREIWPQFAPQFTGQVFLLDQPGSVLAEAVADVDRVSNLNEALRYAESDKRAASSELKIRVTDQFALEAALKTYAGLDDLTQDIEAIEADVVKATKLEQALQNLQSMFDRWTMYQDSVKWLSPVDLIEVSEDGVFNLLRDNIQKIEAYSTLVSKHTTTAKTVSHLSGIESIEHPEDKELEAVKLLGDEIGTLESLTAKLAIAQKAVQKLSGLPDLDEVDFASVDKLYALLTALEGLSLRKASVKRDADKHQSELAQAEDELLLLHDEIHTQLGMGECPTCGSSAHLGAS